MGAEILELNRRLLRFDSRQTPSGLLARYAAGRVKHFASRQVLTLSGAVSLIVLVSPGIGLLAVMIALLGEAVDCLLLTSVPRMFARGMSYARVTAWATATAVFQAVTISACVALAWVTAPDDAAMFFCLAYLTGATINSGIVLPFHRPSAIGRLCVYAIVFVVLFLSELYHSPMISRHTLYSFFGAGIMSYMVYVFISFVTAGYERERRNSRDLLRQGLELARANASMKDQQQELRRLALVAQRAHDSVIMSDTQGRILWVNDTFERITGFTAEEVIGRRPADILNGPDTSEQTSREIFEAIQDGRSHRAEITNYTKDGRRIWVETNLAPVFDSNGNMEMVIAIERDITVAKQHQEELARAKGAAEEGERAKSEFLASMSHEIRTPMNGIIGMADLLAEAELSEDNRLYVQTIRHSAQALLTIINDILDFSKLQAGKLVISPVAFDLPGMVADVLNLMRPQAQAKGLALTTVMAPDLPGFVLGDDVRLRQILVNIVGNAIKFTEAGEVDLVLDCEAADGRIALRIDVRDSGIGIPSDRIDTVFEQFEQADLTTTRRYGGTGLGLAISRRLARKMDGDITATSVPGQGSTFSIHVMLDPADDSTVTVAGDDVFPSSEQLAGLRVLLAEDNRTNRLVIRKFLQDQPVELLTANDGIRAVEMAREQRPDVVLMDMSMPEMDGIEATRAIRRLPGPQPRIVALTANAYQSDRDACLEAGMDAFLTKPVRKVRLLQELACARQPGGRRSRSG